MRRTMLAVMLSLGLALVLSAPALAQYQGGYNGGSRDARQNGYQYGYRDGYQHGRVDRGNRQRYDYRSGDYQRGDSGYNGSMGNRGQFKQGYRDGYQSGYQDGYYNRSARYGGWSQPGYDPRDRDDGYYPQGNGGYYPQGNGGYYPQGNGGYYPQGNGGYYPQGNDYRTVAYDTGYQDGLYEGSKDRGTGHSYRPYEHAAWKDADHNLSTVRADKQDYKNIYRQGYERGYQQGCGRY